MELFELLDQGTTVLTGSRRLAHALRLGFAHEAQRRGRQVWRTPQVMPWTTWLHEQWVEARVLGRAPARRLLSASQTRLLWERVVRESEIGATLLNVAEAARLASRSYGTLRAHLIELEALEDFTNPEAQALLSWARGFERRCAKLHAIDDATLLSWAWDSQLIPEHTLAFVGFDTFTPAVKRLVDRWTGQGRVAVIPAEPACAPLDLCEAFDADDELERAAHWARSQVESGRQNVGIVLHDVQRRREDIRRALEEVFSPAVRAIDAVEEPASFVIAAPQPLAEYPIVATALAVLELTVGADSKLVGRLLRSAFLGTSEHDLDRRALADAQLREEQRDVWDVFALERWMSLSGCDELALSLREVARLHRELPGVAPASVWSEHFHALLRASSWPGARVRTSVEQQTLMKFQATLAELGTLDSVHAPMTLSGALAELQRLCADTSFEPQTASAAVTVIDPMTSAGMHFDAVWVAGLEAGRWPAAAAPDPFIPLPLQRAAAVPDCTAELTFAGARARLRRLARSANRVVFSWPRQEGDAQLQRSPLLAEYQDARAMPLSTSRIRTLQEALFSGRPALQTLRDEHAPSYLGTTARGGAAILELQSQCAFRAQAVMRLHARPLTRVTLGFDARDRGTLIHRVLHRIWTHLYDQAALLALSQTELEAVLQDLAQQEAARTLSPTTPARAHLAALEIRALVRQVKQLLDIDRQRPAFKVRRTEREESITIAGLQLRIQPDRIDESSSGVFLIDYKLGASQTPRGWLDMLPGRPERPQLPVYALAHEHELAGLAFAVLAPGAVEYRGWSNGASIASGVLSYPNATSRRIKNAPADWAQLLSHWRGVLHSLAERFVAGHAAVDPLPTACSYCHLSTFCRVHERVLTDEDGDE